MHCISVIGLNFVKHACVCICVYVFYVFVCVFECVRMITAAVGYFHGHYYIKINDMCCEQHLQHAYTHMK